jgi:hypothetical protein
MLLTKRKAFAAIRSSGSVKSHENYQMLKIRPIGLFGSPKTGNYKSAKPKYMTLYLTDPISQSTARAGCETLSASLRLRRIAVWWLLGPDKAEALAEFISGQPLHADKQAALMV